MADSAEPPAIQSEAGGGIHLEDVLPGTVIVVETENQVYTIVSRDNGETWISGHPIFCPEPVLVHIQGSSRRAGVLWKRYIGRGMHLEITYPDSRQIRTSRIVDVRESTPNPPAELSI